MSVSELEFVISEFPPPRLDKALFRDAPEGPISRGRGLRD